MLNPLLFGIVTNFRAGDPWDDMLMSRLCAAEKRLTETEEIEPDFRTFVGSRRGEGPAAESD